MNAEVSSLSQANELGFPIAIARLKAGRGFWRWVVAQCPIPGCIFREHVHGGGSLDEDPKKMLGHRNHLDRTNRGYLIVDGYPEDSAKLIAKVHGLIRRNAHERAC